MKRGLLLILTVVALTLMLTACGNTASSPTDDKDTTTQQDVVTTPSTQTQTFVTTTGDVSNCESDYITDRTRACMAYELRDLDKCMEIDRDSERQSCIIPVAKVLYDKAQAGKCLTMTANEHTQIHCQALMKHDADLCLTMEPNFYSMAITRDCIYNVAQKLDDKEICDMFVDESQTLFDMCKSGDCEGAWLGEGATEHKDECRQLVVEFNA